MNPEVRVMLDKTYALFLKEFGKRDLAWDYFIEFLAADHNPLLLNQLNNRLEWLAEGDLFEAISDRYDQRLLQTDQFDHLGQMYLEKIATKEESASVKRLLRPTDSLLEATIKLFENRSKPPETILDPEAGTGRWLMAVHSVSPNSKLFGVEKNLRLFRIAYTNLAILGIPAYLLHANQLEHQISFATTDGERNWWHANSWYSCQDKLAPRTRAAAEDKSRTKTSPR